MVTHSRAMAAQPGKHANLGRIEVAANLLDVSPRTVRRMISRGELTGYRIGPRLLRVDLNEVAAIARALPTARSTA